jgi:hypothetical protein
MTSKELYHQAEDYFFRAISKSVVEIDPSTTAYLTSVPVENLNPVYIQETPAVLENILTETKSLYGQHHLPYEIFIDEAFCTAEIENKFHKAGYHPIGKSVTMVLNLENFHAHNSEYDQFIKPNDHHLDEWMTPMITAFQNPLEVCSQYKHAHENALKKGFHLHHFSLYLNEKAVSSLTLSVNNHIARIDDVSTMTELQGNHYATHLMNHALAFAKKLGATQCYLESSAAGFSIYQRIGFKMLFRNKIFK